MLVFAKVSFKEFFMELWNGSLSIDKAYDTQWLTLDNILDSL